MMRTLFYLIILISFFGCGKTLHIVVPDGYIGEVNLIKSNVKADQLILDSNGIGYITAATYDAKHGMPVVVNTSGKDLSTYCIGYSPSAFWAIGKLQAPSRGITLQTLSFEIVTDSEKNPAQSDSKDLLKLVDTLKLK